MSEGFCKYRVDIGTLPTLIVAAASFGFAAVLAYGGLSEDVEPLVIGGETWIAPAGMRVAFFALAAAMLAPGVFIAVQMVRLRGQERFVALDETGVFTSGLGLSGGIRRIAYGDVSRFNEVRDTGFAALEIIGRDGMKLVLPTAAFESRQKLDEFSAELKSRLSAHDPSFGFR